MAWKACTIVNLSKSISQTVNKKLNKPFCSVPWLLRRVILQALIFIEQSITFTMDKDLLPWFIYMYICHFMTERTGSCRLPEQQKCLLYFKIKLTLYRHEKITICFHVTPVNHVTLDNHFLLANLKMLFDFSTNFLQRISNIISEEITSYSYFYHIKSYTN